jgi:hypothetical protein
MDDPTQAIEEAIRIADPAKRRARLIAIIKHLRQQATEVGDAEALKELDAIERDLLGSRRR